MSQIEIAFVASGLLLAGLIKGVTGIGYSTCALPMLVAAVGLRAAMAIIIVPAIVSNAAVIAGSTDLKRVIIRFWRFYGGIIPGIALGAYALLHVDAMQATQFLGWITLAYVGLTILRPNLYLRPRLERVLALPAGILNGFLTGLTGSQILPLMPYMLSLRLATGEQVQAVNLAVTFASIVLAVSLAKAGIMTPEWMALSFAGAVPAALGVLVGNRLRLCLRPQAFKTLTLGTLALMGAAMACAERRDASFEASVSTTPVATSLAYSPAADLADEREEAERQ